MTDQERHRQCRDLARQVSIATTPELKAIDALGIVVLVVYPSAAEERMAGIAIAGNLHPDVDPSLVIRFAADIAESETPHIAEIIRSDGA